MSNEEIQQAVKRAVASMPSREKILRIRLFGSQLHGTSRPDSDVDLLLDLKEQVAIGYFELAQIQLALEKEIGKSVDLGFSRSLRKEIRDEVLAEARTIYE